MPTSVQFAPALSQRCHFWAKVIGGVPVQVPTCPVSVWPAFAVPVIDGALVLVGGRETTVAVCADVAVALPKLPVAVTTTWIFFPTSVGVSTYVVPVALGMSVQTFAGTVHRCHCREKLVAAGPTWVHVPFVAVRVAAVLCRPADRRQRGVDRGVGGHHGR